MREPFHQTVDREYPHRDDFAGLDCTPSGLLDLGPATLGEIRPTIRGGDKTDEWLVSLAAPIGDDSVWPCCNARTLQPGMTAQVIYHDAIRRDVRLSALARELSLAGALIRTTSSWLPDMVISDRQVAILVADLSDLSAGTISIEHPAIIAILAGIFDQAWNAAVPLASSREPQSPDGTRELREAERNLLKLLAVGMTDETVARQLGISLRTTRRHIAALMSHLAASSRFQAGAEAAKRGWLS
jgi:DNA-binding CsgD family transcriptional regulator